MNQSALATARASGISVDLKSMPSITDMTRHDLRPLVENLQFPSVLLDHQGYLDTMNQAAISCWKQFKLNASLLFEEDIQHQPEMNHIGSILPLFLELGIPTKLAGVADEVFHILPLLSHKALEISKSQQDTTNLKKIDGFFGEWHKLSFSTQAEADAEQSVLSEQLAIYQDVAEAVNSSLILEDIFESLADVLANYLLFDEGVIVILDDTQNGIKLLVRFYPDGSLDISGENHAFAGYDALVDVALREQQAQIYSQAYTQAETSDQDFSKSIVVLDNAQSALVVPLVNKGMVIGLISLSAVEPNTYNTISQQLLQQVSTQLAVAVENAKLYWQTQAQASREFLINQLTMAIRQSLDIDMILSTAVMELGKVLGVSRCFIRYDESVLLGNNLASDYLNKTQNSENSRRLFAYHLPGVSMLKAWQKNSDENLQVSEQTPELDFEESVFQLRKEQTHNPFILNDVRDCPPVLAEQDFFAENNIKSIAVIPILIRNALVGTITLHQCEAYRSWVMEDIELIKAMAEHLGVALQQATLFHTLDQKNHQLEETLQELQQAQLYLIQSEKMAVLGQFVAGIAHEVNTPLGTMISNTNTLNTCLQKIHQLNLPETDDSTRIFTSMQGLLNLNKMAGERIQEIVKNLRNFARLDESEMKTVEIHQGIESTILVMSSSIPQGIEIVRNYASNVPQIACYPGLLNQVFMNLLVNATHALEDRLQKNEKSENKEPAKITIQSEFNTQSQQLSVHFSDTGKGIPPENLSRIFDPGFTTKGVGVGTGLGLALCYRIIEKHHGRIFVESTLGEGTTFTVMLPVKTKV